jgi:hypothetical protein
LSMSSPYNSFLLPIMVAVFSYVIWEQCLKSTEIKFI